MLKAYQFRLCPNKEQAILLNKHFGSKRWVYNWAIDQKIIGIIGGEIPSWIEIQAQLPVLKRAEETKWLNEIDAHALQFAVQSVDKAFKNFFKRQGGFPNYKCYGNHDSFFLNQNIKINFNTKSVKLPKFKTPIRIRFSRKFTGKVKNATVSRNPSGQYFISFLVEKAEQLPVKAPITRQTAIGIDLGLIDFAVTSTGVKFANPKHFKKSEEKLAFEQQKLARKQKGSNNRNKQRIHVARVHLKVKNQRHDFCHKLSSKLVRENQTLIFEDLSVEKMKQGPYSKGVSHVGWGMFKNFCKYKCDWHGKNFLEIGRFEPSTKLCTCGVINRSLSIRNRVWTCSSCNATHDRDILAANNIKNFGLAAVNTVGSTGI